MQFIRESTPVARKRHECLACFELSECDLFTNPHESKHWEPEDKETLKALADNRYINKGEKYYHQVYTYDGEICDYRAKIAAHKLFMKYVYEAQ